jgi:2-amino-4-hydroxy-6-hydroxymethyldihydropteridine diphosphokinase
MIEVFLGIGGNLGNRISNIDTAVGLIAKNIGKIRKKSSIYISEPWGFTHPKYFTNIVISIETNLSGKDILSKAKKIELDMKRVKTTSSYEGRTIDIDILSYGNKIINTPELSIPHNRMHERLFVLMPMCEIAPNYVHPLFNENISTLLKKCKDLCKIRKLNYGT